MEKLGIVKEVNDEDLYVEVARESPCGVSCDSCHLACNEGRTEIVRVKNFINAKEGDVVIVEISSRNLLGFFLLVYGLPLLFMFVGICLSYYILMRLGIKNYEVISLFIGILSLALAYLLINKYDKKHESLRDNYVSVRKYKV